MAAKKQKNAPKAAEPKKTAQKKTGANKNKPASSRTAARGNTSGNTAAATTAAASTQGTSVNRPAPISVPGPAAWEKIDWNNKNEWQMGLTRQEYSDELPRRLEQFLNGPNMEKQQPFHWKALTDFLRSKVPFVSATEEDTAAGDPQSNAKSSKRGKKETPPSPTWAWDEDWKVHRALGAGNFGKVALWVKRNANNQIVDEMAIKESKVVETGVWLKKPKGLATEAVLHHHMNKSEVENIVQLRGYKEMSNAPPEHPGEGDLPKGYNKQANVLWRFYLEFSPHGELSRLMDRYRAWNQYLPEAFLWHVFDSLALALLTKAELPTDLDELPKTDIYTEEDRIIHFDIKPDNIFLGYAQPFNVISANKFGGLTQLGGSKRTLYPIIKLGDFGIADLVGGVEDENNPKVLWGMGTPFYQAPEMAHYGVTWRAPPNGTKRYRTFQNHNGGMIDIPKKIEDDKDPGIQFGQELDVWNVGKVIYDLTTLGRKWSYAKLSTRRYKQYREWGHNAISDFQTKPFSQVNNARPVNGVYSPYSEELMELIKACMKPRKAERPSPQDLRRQTQEGLQRYVDEAETKAKAKKAKGGKDFETAEEELLDSWKVYFEKNDINSMEPGEEDFKYCNGEVLFDGVKLADTKDDVDRILSANMDPDWDELQLPKIHESRVKDWRRAQAKKSKNSYWRDHAKVKHDKITFTDPSDAQAEKYKRPTSPARKPSPPYVAGGSDTEDGSAGTDSTTTSESESELQQKLDRKRKRKNATDPALVQDDPEPSITPAVAEDGQAPAVSSQPDTTTNVDTANTQPAPVPTVPPPTNKPAAQQPQRKQPSRNAKKRKTSQE